MEKEGWENSDAELGGIGIVATARKNDPRPIVTARSKTMRVDVEAPERLAVLATVENPVPYIVLCCAIYPLSACSLGEVADRFGWGFRAGGKIPSTTKRITVFPPQPF